MLENDVEQPKASATSVASWIERLNGLSPLLNLPVDRPRRSERKPDRARLSFSIPEPCTEALSKVSNEYDAPLFITLLVAYKILLYRYSNQQNISIACPFIPYASNEKTEGKNGLPAPLFLQSAIAGDLCFKDLLERTKEVFSYASAHRDLSFDSLIKAVYMEQDMNLSVLYQLMFSFLSIKELDLTTGGSLPESSVITNTYSGSELFLSLNETPLGLMGEWNYDPYLFNADTISRMTGHFRMILEGITTSPEQPISRIPILTKEERHQLIYGWNDTFASYPHNKCIHQLFEEQVKRTPDAIAITRYTAPEKNKNTVQPELTYHELNSRANQLADYLQHRGIGPEVPVGIFIERSLEMAIAILGVLKAGGAYLPLDPSYPRERLGFMLEDAQVTVLLTQQTLLPKLPGVKATSVCLDSDWKEIAKHTNENVSSGVGPENLCYIIYTSGSTGKPKGTLIVHRGVVNYLSWCIQAYAVKEGRGAPVNSSIAFDATVTSFFSPLLTGKRVLLLPEKEEIEALSNVLNAENNFSLVKITPAHLQLLSPLLPAHRLNKQTNAFVIGGENLQRSHVEHWLTHAPGTRLINEYGPTETVVGCCIHEISGKDLLYTDVPIGRPIANTQMYILDPHMQPVPVGVAGEIYIGGAGLARGYLNRPELTENRFVHDPFTASPSRLYKTGDVGRFLPNGTIAFLGRIDHQVKIRGYRIELGEIEASLTRHPAIKQAAVLAREDKAGDKRLVAYLVLHPNYTLRSKEIRLFLKNGLPEYMVPAVFVFLQTMPTTTNGKIDRAALPIPDQQRPELEEAFQPPRDDLERTLTTIFEECLNVKPIGIQDNFFELGANSLQAGYIFSRVNKILGKQLHLSMLLKSPTIEQLAAYIRNKETIEPWSSLVPIQPDGSKPPLFCIHGGVGTVLFYRQLSLQLGPDQPFYGLQAKGLNGTETPHSSIQEMATEYIKEIRTVQQQGPYHLGGYCFGGIVAFEMAKQLTAQGYTVALLANFNAVSPSYVDPANPVVDSPQEKSESPFLMGNRLSKKMLLLSIKDKLIHILKTLFHKLNHWRIIILYGALIKIHRLIYTICIALKRPLPNSLARFYLLSTNTSMVNAYRPEPYTGQMVIFRSPKIYPDPHLGWSSLIAGNIETYDIAGDHQNRRVILDEPFVAMVSDKLKNLIVKEKSISHSLDTPVK